MSSKRYCPNLLPPEHRVLPDYFRGIACPLPEHTGLKSVSTAAGIVLLAGSLFTLAYLPFFLVLSATGLLLLPGIGQVVARAFQLHLTGSVRRITLIALLALNLPFAVAFGKVKSQLAAVRRTELLQEHRAAQQAARTEQQRKDSLDACLQRVAVFQEQGKTDKALITLDKADLLAKTTWESADVDEQRIEVSLAKAKELMQKRQHNMAIGLLNDVYLLDTNDTEVLYLRACCYAKTDRIADAVHDARRAMLRGHEAAGTLYEQLNPLRKRVAYYTTLCRDGTFSDAKGRGACSHHDGVANWNYPVYETYRQYE